MAMNYKNTLFFFLFAGAFCGCHKNEVKKTTARWDGLEHQLTAEPIASDSVILEFSEITSIGDYLIIGASHADKIFSLYKLQGDSVKYQGSFLNKGRGPAEVMAANLYYLPEYNSVVMVGYNFFGRNIVVPVDKIENLLDVNTWKIYDNDITYGHQNIRPIDTSSFILHKFSGQDATEDDCMFATFAVGDTTLTTIAGIVYPKDNVNVEFRERADMYAATQIVKRPGYPQFVNSIQDNHYVKVFTLNESRQVASQFDLFNELPEYTADVNGNAVRGKSNKSGLHSDVSKNYIYLSDPKLTNETRSRAREINGYPPGYCKEIYVSDWEGKPVVKYVADVPICYFAVDDNEEYAYVCTYDQETLEEKLVRFRLPKLD